jgi:hypothetical protein
VSESSRALTLQLLDWIASHPRTRDEVLDAWRTTCPKLSIWEDACTDGLIDSVDGFIVVSVQGQSLLHLVNENHDTR